jgi:cell division protein ZapA (FtsZ GTPase activity inhibitor)
MMRSMSSPRPGLRAIKVQVAGQTLALRTDATPAYVRELAAMLDERLATVRDKQKPMSTQALALLLAMQLADELRQSEARTAELRRDVRARGERILRQLEVLDPENTEPPSPRSRRRKPASESPWPSR